MAMMTRVFAIGVAALLAMAGPAAAAFPERPVRMVVPYGPGGTGDVIARSVAQKLEQAWGQPVVVENRPGAAGMIGAQLAARSEPDGHTVLLGYTSEMVIAPYLLGQASYDVERDFVPLALAGVTPLLLVARAGIEADTLDAFVEQARAKPGAFSYATAGKGSPAHIAGLLLERGAGIELLEVPYKGGSQAVADVVAGNVDIYFSGMPPALPFVQQGRLKAYGVSARQPSPALPQAPALAAGALRELDLNGWFGFFAPAGLSAERVRAWNEALQQALSDSEVRRRLLGQGVEITATTPEAFGDFVRKEKTKYAGYIGQFGLRQE